MKLSRSVIILLFTLASTPLFSLDIYFNDILWKSYHQEDLESIQIKFSHRDIAKNSSSAADTTAIPFKELLPLISEIEGIRISIPSGDIFLREPIENFRTSYLKADSRGIWDLNLNNSVYHDPGRIEVYGTPLDKKDFILWMEPGIYGVKEQIDVWSSLHRINIEIKEIFSLRDELIHRQMTGDLMPDFVLQFQSAPHPYRDEKTIAFILQSIMTPLRGQETETLVLPSGHKLHPDLFMSILASLSERVSPYDPVFLTGKEEIRQTTQIFFQQLLSHRIVEQDDFFLDKSYRNTQFAFFPARAFQKQKGYPASLPQLPGMEQPLSPRVYPLQLTIENEMLPEGTLLDFLKLPGIQHNLLSLSHRQLPEMTEALADRPLNKEEQDLYEEWKRGYILSETNYDFRKEIERRLPDLFRAEGGFSP